jgi:hypothetical protein
MSGEGLKVGEVLLALERAAIKVCQGFWESWGEAAAAIATELAAADAVAAAVAAAASRNTSSAWH